MKYLYRPQSRPAGFATLPPRLVWEYAEMPPDLAHRRPELPYSSHLFGVIATTRALTAEECEHYSLKACGSVDESNASELSE